MAQKTTTWRCSTENRSSVEKFGAVSTQGSGFAFSRCLKSHNSRHFVIPAKCSRDFHEVLLSIPLNSPGNSHSFLDLSESYRLSVSLHLRISAGTLTQANPTLQCHAPLSLHNIPQIVLVDLVTSMVSGGPSTVKNFMTSRGGPMEGPRQKRKRYQPYWG